MGLLFSGSLSPGDLMSYPKMLPGCRTFIVSMNLHLSDESSGCSCREMRNCKGEQVEDSGQQDELSVGK